MFRIEYDLEKCEAKEIPLTPEEIAALPPPTTLEQRKAIIDAQRAARYAKEADPYFVQATYKPEKAEALIAEGLRIKAQIKSELPYEVE